MNSDNGTVPGGKKSSVASVNASQLNNAISKDSDNAPITSTVISNVRGRSIIAGNKDVIVNVNGSKQELTADNNPQTL